jgi:hypothetical protein
MTRSCPDCGAPLRKLDVMSTLGSRGSQIIQRTFECSGCRAVWLSEEAIRGRHDKRWLPRSGAPRLAGDSG